jgi:hypothetical protein
MDAASFVWLAVIVLFFAAVVTVQRRRRAGQSVGPGTSGAIYDMLNEDKRKAIEIIVEEKAEERDPETADGNLPELEAPKKPW